MSKRPDTFWNKVRGYFRLIHFFVHTFYWLVAVTIRSKASPEKLMSMRQKWARGMVRLLNFKLDISGPRPPEETALYICNHRSSLDPLILLSDIKAWPVSRHEVKNWPLVGKGGEKTGIIFVDKSSRESRAMVKEALLREMQSGKSILIFPEGRTNVKLTTATFQKGSFEQAAAGGYPVIPISMEYKYKTDYWDHSDSFTAHFVKNFGKRETPIRIIYGDPIRSDNSWTLLRQAQSWIDEHILEIRREWDGSETVEKELALKD
jgi:1-acyl-sn-glycerol-3-phosphate acyltransferase